MGCHSLLQGIFLTQKSNLHLLHWQVDSLPLSHLGSSFYFYFYLYFILLLYLFIYTFISISSCTVQALL